MRPPQRDAAAVRGVARVVLVADLAGEVPAGAVVRVDDGDVVPIAVVGHASDLGAARRPAQRVAAGDLLGDLLGLAGLEVDGPDVVAFRFALDGAPAKSEPLAVASNALMPFPVVNPLLTGSQLSPLSVERSTPTGPPRGSPPAKIYPLALMANERNVAFGTPVLSPVQLSPLSVERKAPPPKVAAKMSPLALIASAVTYVFVKPLSTRVQLSPLSVER